MQYYLKKVTIKLLKSLSYIWRELDHKEIISFFGASVTQQRRGYVNVFRNLSKKQYFITQNGYGSMHLNDAGICFIDEVLKEKPNYCFIEWFSTGYVESNVNFVKLIETIILKFSESKCKLVFLFFPVKSFDKKRAKMISVCKKILFKYDIAFIDLTNLSNASEGILRDDVHTTEEGSKKYGELIFNEFNKIKVDLKVPLILPKKNKYSAIKSILVNKKVNNFIDLVGDGEIIGFFLCIGPNTGAVKVNGKSEILWDKWCYYKRDNFKCRIPKVTGSVRVELDKEILIDTNGCKIKLDWNKFEKHLYVFSIFYIGELSIVDLR